MTSSRSLHNVHGEFIDFTVDVQNSNKKLNWSNDMDEQLAETLIGTVRAIVPVAIGLLLHLAITAGAPLPTVTDRLLSATLALMIIAAYAGWARFLESYVWWPLGILLGWPRKADDSWL